MTTLPNAATDGHACKEAMPRVPFGRATISRLILGANPINAGSHLSSFVNHQMRRYFTVAGTIKILRDIKGQFIETLGFVKTTFGKIGSGHERMVEEIFLCYSTGQGQFHRYFRGSRIRLAGKGSCRGQASY